VQSKSSGDQKLISVVINMK